MGNGKQLYCPSKQPLFGTFTHIESDHANSWNNVGINCNNIATLIQLLKKNVWCNALYLLHKLINSNESRFNLFGLLTNSTQRIIMSYGDLARGGLKLVTFRSQSSTLSLYTTHVELSGLAWFKSSDLNHDLNQAIKVIKSLICSSQL